jgi:hypothetical protein
MTVLVREDLNESDLLWAAADLAVAGAQGQALRARVAAARLAPGWSAPAGDAPAQGPASGDAARGRP